MNDQLCAYWNNHFCISKLKMNAVTWQWFQAADHSSWSVNNLEVYNFTHYELSFQIHIISIHNWLKIIDEDWEWNKSVVIANMFKWMYQFKSNTPHLTNIITEKFNMYHWHLHKVKGQQNYDWLRNMFYEIVQQIVQQSSVYYLTYIALCSDHNHCIILYSYYTKYQEKMNKTFFWHIDLNIPWLVKNHKKVSLIQKFILLDSEQKNDCTEMLLDMQNHLSNWWKNVQARLQARDRTASDGLIHWITHRKWTKKDITKYDLNFKSQLCHKSQIQVSLLHLLHEAQSSKDICWTVLLWYIRITVNHKILNISEFST